MSVALTGYSAVPETMLEAWLQEIMTSDTLTTLFDQPSAWLTMRQEPSDFHCTFECADSLVATVAVGALVCPNRDVLSDAAVSAAIRELINDRFAAWMDGGIEEDAEFAGLTPVGHTADGKVILG